MHRRLAVPRPVAYFRSVRTARSRAALGASIAFVAFGTRNYCIFQKLAIDGTSPELTTDEFHCP
jgi:hypothetical protein